MGAAGMAGRRAGAARTRAVFAQAAPVSLGVFLYFTVRGLTAEDGEAAVRHARWLAGWEQSLGIYHEPAVQGFVDRFDGFITVMNWVYIWGHWPVIATTLVWLVLRHPAGFRVMRDAMLASGVVGLVVFVLYPVAPPRLAGLGLADTVTERSESYRLLQPKAFVNQYAAMPSLHVGWDLLVGVALFTCGGHLVLRIFGVLLPLFMIASVVATANHYIIDAVVGVVLVLACRAAAVGVERRRRRPAPGSALIPRQRSGESVARLREPSGRGRA